jgi:peptidoglycan-N-acetylglucosamine deacetylase
MSALSVIGKEVLQKWFRAEAFMWRLPSGLDSALTFDDGPHEVYTPKILDLLATYDVKATFFVIGESAVRCRHLVRRIADEGHLVASHTYSHQELPNMNPALLQSELGRCRAALQELTGIDTNLVRPPRGRVTVRVLMLAKELGYRVVHWSKTYSDYMQDGAAPLLRRIRTAGLSPRDIALLHDNNSYTVEALAEIIPEWRSQGRSFVKLS